ncbi:DUF397 domain-containing protein [Spirillospora sp. CA-253888]
MPTARSQPAQNLHWRKATRSQQSGACVELAASPGDVNVRDSVDPHGPMLTFQQDAFAAFAEKVRAGAYDL